MPPSAPQPLAISKLKIEVVARHGLPPRVRCTTTPIASALFLCKQRHECDDCDSGRNILLVPALKAVPPPTSPGGGLSGPGGGDSLSAPTLPSPACGGRAKGGGYPT